MNIIHKLRYRFDRGYRKRYNANMRPFIDLAVREMDKLIMKELSTIAQDPNLKTSVGSVKPGDVITITKPPRYSAYSVNDDEFGWDVEK